LVEYIYKNPKKISVILLVCLGLNFILDLLSLWSNYSEYNLLVYIDKGAFVSDEDANSNDIRQAIVGISQILLYIVTVVFFCIWIHRIVNNAHSFANSMLRYTPGWAVGYFFIPILNLFRPYQALNQASQVFIDNETEGKRKVLFPLWWTFWIITNIVDRIVFKIIMRAEELDELIDASLISMGADVVNISLGIITLCLVFYVSKANLAYNTIIEKEKNDDLELKSN